MTPAVSPTATVSATRGVRLAAACAVASAVIGAVGVVFLIGMFASFAVGGRSQGRTLGLVNDVMIIVSLALIVPAMLALRARLGPHAPWAINVATAVGLAAVAAIVVLQAMLVRGDLTLAEQIGWVSVAFIAFDAWLLVTGWVGRRSGLLPDGVRMGLIGATYVGYPAWALWAARRLASGVMIGSTDPPGG